MSTTSTPSAAAIGSDCASAWPRLVAVATVPSAASAAQTMNHRIVFTVPLPFGYDRRHPDAWLAPPTGGYCRPRSLAGGAA